MQYMDRTFLSSVLQILDAAKPKVVAATPGWGGWGGDGVREWEKSKKTLEISWKKTKQGKLNALMNADVDPSKVWFPTLTRVFARKHTHTSRSDGKKRNRYIRCTFECRGRSLK